MNHAREIPDLGPTESVAIQAPSIAVNATDLYFVLNWQSGLKWEGYLMRIPREGGKAVRVAPIPGGNASSLQNLAVTPTGAVFTRPPQAGETLGAIVRASRDGRDVRDLAPTQDLARALLVDDANAYFVDAEGTKAVALTGGPVRTVAASKPTYLALKGSMLYLAESGALSAVPVAGGTPSVIAHETAQHPIACGESMCWLGGGLAGVLVQLTSDGTRSVLAEGFSEPHALVFDGTNLFITVGAAGLGLIRVPAGGGPPLLAAPQPAVSLALDDECLYWAGAAGIFSLALRAADTADLHSGASP